MVEKSADETATQTLGQGRFLRLVRGREQWEYVERVGCRNGVAIVATTSAGELILIEEGRVPVGCPVISLPAGLIGDDEGGDEDPVRAGLRELAEETGFVATSGEILQAGPVSPGLTSERIFLLRAGAVTRQHAGGGLAGENIVVHVVPLPRLAQFLAEREAAGCEIDHKVQAALFWLGLRPQDLGWALPIVDFD